MTRDSITGSRIRERRLMVGLRQTELARQAEISASYLNLIEHNRRPIGGKLLVTIARILAVEPSVLTEGAQAALISGLREAAIDAGIDTAELDRAEEFAGRFSGWAEALVAGHRRVASLERIVETLSDRLTHDPQLAASLHEVLSTAAAIRSTASILVEIDEVDADWRDRFHRNLNQDSRRLAESSKALLAYLDESPDAGKARGTPQEEVDAFLTAHAYHFPELEQADADPKLLAQHAPELTTDAARQIAAVILTQIAEDARTLPIAPFRAALGRVGLQPAALGREFACDLPTVFRRLAAMPPEALPGELGLVVCDASGSILFRRAMAGFVVPRFAASCPLWPLFTALARPMMPIRRRVEQAGSSPTRFDCWAIAWPQQVTDFNADPLLRSYMLILPVADQGGAAQSAHKVGSSCRVCPREACSARREPSVMAKGFDTESDAGLS
ncbi:helix-turn-helix domain-containing protein [Pontibaca salina]|uniref:DUF2083 domain-containing protein n=1 Tax=Pontibaca salina TaxID=2795731 RepID=A0A934HQA3_9RHOB|nr:helix-turn-helix transcriptional regulator [Pontibaca salina]MBI6628640.1 DUF2083 domain-containing protein [Pontibaca salina]